MKALFLLTVMVHDHGGGGGGAKSMEESTTMEDRSRTERKVGNLATYL